MKRSVIINKVTNLVITKLDVLDGLEKIKVCVGYKYKGKTLKSFPHNLEGIQPVYREFKGWSGCINAVRKFSNLPLAARNYVRFIEDFLGVRVTFISVGERREAIFQK